MSLPGFMNQYAQSFIVPFPQLTTTGGVKILWSHRLVQGNSTGPATVELPRLGGEPWDRVEVEVASNSSSLTPVKLDPIVASLRLTAENPSSHLTTGTVRIEILPGLFFAGEETEVTVSVILSDGRRLLITDPNEINIKSSNNSIVSVRSENIIVAENSGMATLNVSWVVCGETLANALVDLVVQFDENRPFFEPDEGNATVPEDSEIGHSITQVQAMDDDVEDVSGIHAEVRYNIRNDPYNGLFVVNPVTGVVTLNGPLDRETKDQYTLLIEATDRQQRQLLECLANMANTTTTTTTPTSVAPTTSNETVTEEDASGSGSDRLTPTTEPPSSTPPDNNTVCDPVGAISVFTVSCLVFTLLLSPLLPFPLPPPPPLPLSLSLSLSLHALITYCYVNPHAAHNQYWRHQ